MAIPSFNPLEYRLLIDWLGTGEFEHLNADVFGDVIRKRMTAQRGRQYQRGVPQASAGRFSFELRNNSTNGRRYAPGQTLGDLLETKLRVKLAMRTKPTTPTPSQSPGPVAFATIQQAPDPPTVIGWNNIRAGFIMYVTAPEVPGNLRVEVAYSSSQITSPASLPNSAWTQIALPALVGAENSPHVIAKHPTTGEKYVPASPLANQNGKYWAVRLSTVNAFGGSSYVYEPSGGTTIDFNRGPERPVIVSATPNNARIDLTWRTGARIYMGQTHTALDPSITRIDYKCWKSSATEPSTWRQLTTDYRDVSATLTTESDGTTALVNGIAYRVRLRTANASTNRWDGSSADPGTRWSIGSTLVTVNQAAPVAPTNFVVMTTPLMGQLVLRWNHPYRSNVSSFEYRVRVGTGTYGNWQIVPNSTGTQDHWVFASLPTQPHTYQIRARNAVGAGAATGEATATPLSASLPAKPVGLVGYFSTTSVRLDWDDPNNINITGYQYSQDGGSWQTIPGAGAATTDYNVTGLTTNTLYEFRIRARTSAGWGPASDPVAVITTLVNYPPNLRLVAEDGQAKLVWFPSTSGDTLSGSYQYSYAVSSAAFGEWLTIPGGNDARSHTVTGLTNGTEYKFRLRHTEEGAASNYRLVTPSEIRTLSATVIYFETVFLDWAAHPDILTTTTPPGMWETRWREQGGSWSSWLAQSAGDLDKDYSNPTIHNNRTYEFQLRGEKSDGTYIPTLSASVAVSLAVPGRVQDMSIFGGDGKAYVGWSPVFNAGVNGYSYTIDDGATWTAVPGGNVNSYIIPNLTNGTQYTVRVRAHNDAGFGAPSFAVNVIPLADPATLPPARLVGIQWTAVDGGVDLEWTNPNNPFIDHYEYRFRLSASGDMHWRVWRTIPGSDSDTEAYSLRGLENGELYQVEVRAVNSAGAGLANPIVVTFTPTSPWLDIWGGVIEDISYNDRRGRNDSVSIHCLGALSYLAQQQPYTALQENSQISENVLLLCQASNLPEGLIGNFTASRSLQWWWSNRQNALRAARTLETTERGALYETRHGSISFDGYDAVQFLQRQGDLASFSDDLTASTSHLIEANVLQAASEFINAIRVPVRRFSTGVEAVLWQYDAPILIPANGRTRLVGQHDLNGVAAWTPLAAGTDYAANQTAAGGGADRTSDLRITPSFYAQQVVLDIANTSSTALYVTKLQARGRELRPRNSTVFEDEIDASIRKFGRRELTLSESWFNELLIAESAGRRILALRSQPADRMQISFYAGHYPALAGSVEIARPVSVRRRGANADYLIDHVRHDFGQNAHRVTLSLSPILTEANEIIVLDQGPPLGVGRLG